MRDHSIRSSRLTFLYGALLLVIVLGLSALPAGTEMLVLDETGGGRPLVDVL